ncbi:MAG TPA: hypothetical protein VD815_07625 [Candidatus Saccharimonadales bacterium]|nr:hypothetical protein [Candidatus Saccharimonadales bacterium]
MISKINVQITNNGGANEIVSIHVIADETSVSTDSNDISFQAGRTVIQLFKFNYKKFLSALNLI